MQTHEQRIQALALKQSLDWYYATSNASVSDTVALGISIYKELRDDEYSNH